MLNKLKYPALNAKLKGMYASELTKEELYEFSRAGNIKEAIYLLKAKFPELENVNEDMHRKELEQELNNLFIINILKICKYLNKNEKEIFMQFLSKYELNCVKNVFRNVTTNRDSSDSLKNIDNWTTKMFTDINGINQIKEETEFLELIKSSEYYKIFKEYEQEIENVPLEEIEVKLDKFYFNKVYHMAEKENKELQDLIGTEIDLLNIIWIYRSKKYFNYSEDEINDIIIHINYKLNKNTLKELLNVNSYTEILDIVANTKYKNVFQGEETIEHDKNEYLYKKYMKYFKTKLFNICTVFCEINLIDIEIKNIINIIEGIRYNIDRQEIQKKIIC